MVPMGSWSAVIRDIEIPRCEVAFDDKSSLEIHLEPETPHIDDLKTLPSSAGGEKFSVIVKLPGLVTATFHKCHLEAFARGGKLEQFDSNRITKTPGMKFTLRYERK